MQHQVQQSSLPGSPLQKSLHLCSLPQASRHPSRLADGIYPRQSARISCRSGLNPIAEISLSLPILEPVIAGAGILGGVIGLRLWTYSRLEFVVASMLSKHVPRDGARVIQIGGGTRELYYYPKGTVQVTYVGKKTAKGLMEQGGVQAQVPVVVIDKDPGDATLGAGSAADAVVLIKSLASISNLNAFCEEACRVLKPGAPLIFIESAVAEGLTGALQILAGSSRDAIDGSTFNELKSFKGFDKVVYDMALENVSPHAVGIALRSDRTGNEKSRGKKQKSKDKSGFAKSETS